MERISACVLPPQKAAFWFLGQAGYILRGGGVTAAIDPYLSDAAARVAPDFARLYPPPLDPAVLRVDILIVTHGHLDHLDPETIGSYRHKETTVFVAPRLAAHKLRQLGVPADSIRRVDVGETAVVQGVAISGIFALPTGADVLDTAGYRLEFANGRSVYHASDTSFCRLLLKAAPACETLLVPINGKWGNLGVEQAVELTKAVKPRLASPSPIITI